MTGAKPNNLDLAYQAYLSDPTPDKLSDVVDQLNPVINYSLSSMNATTDNLIRNKAKIFAADAVKKYSPDYGAALPTWVSGQLMQLKRFKREVNQPVKVPERVQLDAYTLSRAEQEFIDKFDREPDVEELADYAKMPRKRIEKIRRSFRAMPSQGAIGDGFTQHETDFGAEALDYAYKDADKLDRKIIEMKTGYGGRYEPMPPNKIAAMLGLTPSQLTRRSIKLSLRIQEIEKNLQDIQ
jgi:DNA-directed RNA polymerase specialized sigma subunit